MKNTALIIALLVSSGAASAEYVQGYFKKDGTYVPGYQRSAPNANRYDNNGSQSRGGSQRDEFSRSGGATNKRNSAYGMYDNDRDGYSNGFDPKPESKCNYGSIYGC